MGHVSKAKVALLSYRMQSVDSGRIALGFTRDWKTTPSLSIHFDDRLVMVGKATAFTNAAIEAAIIHSRSLLEFLGLGRRSNGRLRELNRRPGTDDVGIEQFPPLKCLAVDQALRNYAGSSDEAEAALAYVIYLANKGLAHTTESFTKQDDGAHLLDIAFRGVPLLVVNNFFLPLGLHPPKYRHPGWKRAT
jgi:hypothetical protein